MKAIILNLFFYFLIILNTQAEIIENQLKEEREFGPWKVLCTEDVMMDRTSCKAFAKFYNGLGTVHIQPHNKIANQVVIIIPPAKLNTETKVRIDKNNLIKSRNLTANNYGVIPFSNREQKMMLDQMKNGKEFFIRFTTKNSESDKNNEVTIKISLEEFKKMLTFYDQKVK
jgi:hypothetical protein